MELAMKRTDGYYDSHAVDIVVGGTGGAWCIRERNESSGQGGVSGGYLESEYFVRGSDFAPLVESGEVEGFKVRALARCWANSWESNWPENMAGEGNIYWQEGWIEGRLAIREGKLEECEIEFTPTGRKEEEGYESDDLTLAEMARGDRTGRVEAWLREI